jgi:hypothetical protein
MGFIYIYIYMYNIKVIFATDVRYILYTREYYFLKKN